jgi:hypothetical protein
MLSEIRTSLITNRLFSPFVDYIGLIFKMPRTAKSCVLEALFAHTKPVFSMWVILRRAILSDLRGHVQVGVIMTHRLKPLLSATIGRAQ